MKKVIGLCLVVLLSSTSVFARENRRMEPLLRQERVKKYFLRWKASSS